MFTSRQKTTLDDTTRVSQNAMRSLLSDRHGISSKQWVLSVLRKQGTEHSFLLLEGLQGMDRVFFRSDLFLDGDNRSQIQASLAQDFGSGALNMLSTLSMSSGGGVAFIRVKQLSQEEYDAIGNESEYQSFGISTEETELLLRRLIEETGKRCIPYHIAGDHPSWISSTSTLYYHNCATWCRQILKEVLGDRIQIGNQWLKVIQRPSALIRDMQAVVARAEPMQEEQKAPSRGQRS